VAQYLGCVFSSGQCFLIWTVLYSYYLDTALDSVLNLNI